MALKGTVTIAVTFSDATDQAEAATAFADFYPDPVDSNGDSLGLTGDALVEHFASKLVCSRICMYQKNQNDEALAEALEDPDKKAAILAIAAQ